ncbi:MAG: FAD-dependent oxidoreductase [Bacillota bacterium]
MDWDVLIVGGGPAGLAAGLYSARSRLRTAVIFRGQAGGQIAGTSFIENYPGIPGRTEGAALGRAMLEQARAFGCEHLEDEVLQLLPGPSGHTVRLKRQGEQKARAVILSPGTEPRALGVPGEREFRGRGVSYCATCDADMFADFDLVVVGNGDAALEEAIYLGKFAASVTVVVIHDVGVMDATKIIQERALADPKLRFVWNSTIQEIRGSDLVEEVVLRNLRTGEVSSLSTQGVFVFAGVVPRTGFLQGAIALDGRGFIVAGENMETSVPGVFAAGDARQKALRQVITAAADGAVAAWNADRYIATEENFRMQVLERPGTVLVGLWTPAVASSHALPRQLEEAAARLGVPAVVLDSYRFGRIAQRYGAKEPPAVLVFQDGKPVGAYTGTPDPVGALREGGIPA